MNTYYSKRDNNKKQGLIFTCLLLFLAMVCLIVNYAVNHLVSWSMYPVGALLVIWATVIPLLVMKKNKATGSFLGFGITILPFLFLIQYLSPGKGWFIPLALPIALLCIAALGITLLALKYLNISKWYGAAIAVLLFGVLLNFLVGKIVDRYINEQDINDTARYATIFGSALLTLLLGAIGYIKGKKKRI